MKAYFWAKGMKRAVLDTKKQGQDKREASQRARQCVGENKSLDDDQNESEMTNGPTSSRYVLHHCLKFPILLISQ